MWDVEVTDEFVDWWEGLTVEQQARATQADDLYDAYLIELREGLI